jgi:hypothetical protein
MRKPHRNPCPEGPHVQSCHPSQRLILGSSCRTRGPWIRAE